MVECVEKLAQWFQDFDNFLEFEQKIQIPETVVNHIHSVCSVEHALSARTLVSVDVSTESLSYRQEAEGRGVVWTMELESGRALSAMLALQRSCEAVCWGLEETHNLVEEKYIIEHQRGEIQRERQLGVVVYTCNPSSWGMGQEDSQGYRVIPCLKTESSSNNKKK